MPRCYHYGMEASGTCNKCGSLVAVTTATRVQAKVGTGEGAPYGSVNVPEVPTVRAALAMVLGVNPSAIRLEDVVPATGGWERSVTATFTVRDSITATVTFNDTTTRTPEFAEYEEEEAKA